MENTQQNGNKIDLNEHGSHSSEEVKKIKKEGVEMMHQMAKELLLKASLLCPKEFSFQVTKEHLQFVQNSTEEILESINWVTLSEIAVETTLDGESFWVICHSSGEHRRETRVRLPMDTEIDGHQELMDKFFSLEDFDFNTFTECSCSCLSQIQQTLTNGQGANRITTVWKSKSTQ